MEALADDFYRLAVPMKASRSIDAEPVGLVDADWSHVGGPFASVDRITRNALQLVVALASMSVSIGL